MTQLTSLADNTESMTLKIVDSNWMRGILMKAHLAGPLTGWWRRAVETRSLVHYAEAK
jgi:hypothetical protein